MSQQINLAKPQLLKPRYAWGAREMAMVVGVVLVGALAWGGLLHYQAGALETEAAQQEALQAEAQAALDEANATANRAVSALLTERLKLTQFQISQREAVLASLSGTIDTLAAGFSPQMRALAHGDTAGVWLNKFTLAPGYVELQGSTLNAGLLSAYIDRLGRQVPFTGMNFSGMKAAEANATGTATDAGLPRHLDFSLYAGHRAITGEETQHAQ
jgi:hypothetical protein